MINERFISEVERSGLYKGDFQKIAIEFAEYQKLAMDTLKEFHRICIKNNIKYQLAYGSLLGAIRDGGQIPWDYDIDVFVLSEDRGKLISALESDMDNKFYLYSVETDKHCRHFISRMAPKGFDTSVLHVDIFYLMGSKKQDLAHLQSDIKKLALLYKAKHFKMTDPDAKSKRELLLMFKNKVMGMFSSSDDIARKYFLLSLKYKIKEADYLISADRFSDWYKFTPDIFKDTKIISTQDGEFIIPENYAEILKQIYGDYMQLPSLETRLKDMLKHYKNLKVKCPLVK